MVVIGYTITFFVNSGEYGARFTFWELFFGIGFGVIYLLLGLYQPLIVRQFPTGWGEGVFLAVGCALVFGVGWVLGPGGNWLIGLPLVATAVEILSPGRRWMVYGTLVLAGILPIARYGTWTGALNNGFIIASAIAFVVVFTQLRLNEQQAKYNCINSDGCFR